MQRKHREIDQHPLEVTENVLQNHLVPTLVLPTTQREAQPVYTLSQGSKFRDLQANENYKSSLQAQSRKPHSRPQDPQLREENRETIRGMQLWYKILPLNGFKVTHAETMRNLRTFLDPEENPKVILKRTIHWNLEKLVKIFD